MKKYFLFFFFCLSVQFTAQNLDSLYNKYLNVRGISTSTAVTQVQSDDHEHDKCSFGLSAQIRANFYRFSFKDQQVLSTLLNRPVMDTSFISPKGWFRIHFNKSNFPDYVPEYIRNDLTPTQLEMYKRTYLDSMAIAADSAYNFEVNILGYPAPPADNGEGGCDRYDIYIENLGSSTYGYTDFTVGSAISYMRINNYFSSTYSKRIYGARVTLAHEFHHAIQIVYAWNDNDRFYYELSSTAMEEFVFDSINDYYQYLPSLMQNPQRSFARNNGYNLALWNIFLKDRYGYNILKKSWELIKNGQRALNAVNNSILENNSDFTQEFTLFGQWLFFTGWRAQKDKYFSEAEYYPLVRPYMIIPFNRPQTSLEVNSEPVSTNYLTFIDKLDTLVAVVSNLDITNGVNNTSSLAKFNYTLSTNPADGEDIGNGFYRKLTSSMPSSFAALEIFNNIPSGNGHVFKEEIDYPFPQPFRYSRNDYLSLPVEKSQSGYADIYIYSVDMDLVYSGNLKIYITNNVTVRWDVFDNQQKKLATGVYFYVANSDDKIKKGKFVIYND